MGFKQGIPSQGESQVGNTDFNRLGLNKEFPKGVSQEGNSKMAAVGNSLGVSPTKMVDLEGKKTIFLTLKLMQLHTVTGQLFAYAINMDKLTLLGAIICKYRFRNKVRG